MEGGHSGGLSRPSRCPCPTCVHRRGCREARGQPQRPHFKRCHKKPREKEPTKVTLGKSLKGEIPFALLEVFLFALTGCLTQQNAGFPAVERRSWGGGGGVLLPAQGDPPPAPPSPVLSVEEKPCSASPGPARPHLDQEVSCAQSCSPRHPLHIHRFQVLQRRERWRWGELLNWGLR